jgi:hypothetical protein
MILDPIIMTGVPRSRTSLVAGIFQICGLELGDTCGPTTANKRGQFEHRPIIQSVEKPHLKKHGYCPKGQKPLPPFNLPIDYDRRDEVLRLFRPPNGRLWGLKDCKSCLSFDSWKHAFPDATWIIINRDAHEIAKSCLKTSFMAAYNKKYDWLFWVYEYRKYLERAKLLAKEAYELDTGKLVKGDLTEIKDIIGKVDLKWNELQVQAFIDPKLTRI